MDRTRDNSAAADIFARLSVREVELERRRARRIATSEPARAHVADGAHSEPFSATITNVSAEGLALRLSAPVDVGATVLVEWDSAYVPATVRRCTGDSDGFEIGLELESVAVVRTVIEALHRAARRRNINLKLASF